MATRGNLLQEVRRTLVGFVLQALGRAVSFVSWLIQDCGEPGRHSTHIHGYFVCLCSSSTLYRRLLHLLVQGCHNISITKPDTVKDRTRLYTKVGTITGLPRFITFLQASPATLTQKPILIYFVWTVFSGESGPQVFDV